MDQPQPRFPDLANASVLITGGATGIGAALTAAFSAQGASVAFIDIAAEAGEALARDLSARHGTSVRFLEADLRDLDRLKAAADEAARLHGPVGVLVNNAARDDRHSIEDVTGAYWDENQSINLRPQFFAAQAVIPAMKAAGRGTIVNFTSTAFMINGGIFPAYTAAKAGVIGLTKGLAGALGPFGIRVNAIAPGWVITERQAELWLTDQGRRTFIERQCLKRMLEPADMVGPCLFLASEASRGMTAQTMIVDAGYL